MGNNLRDLRRRIRSVKSTQQITRAMKLVASSKLRRAQEAMTRARPYSSALHELIGNVRRRVADDAHPLLAERGGRKTLLVVMTADRGLAGAFNSNVVKSAMRYLREKSGTRDVTLQLVGRKGRDFFRRRSFPIRGASVDLFRKVDMEVSKVVADDLVRAFTEEGFDEVVLLSNRFRTLVAQDLTFLRLLPAGGQVLGDAKGPDTDYLYEPDVSALLGQLIPAAVHVAVHQALLESLAAEMGARMVAMDNATKNAAELISRLTLVMNRTRQASITTEIIEIVSGAAALETRE